MPLLGTKDTLPRKTLAEGPESVPGEGEELVEGGSGMSKGPSMEVGWSQTPVCLGGHVLGKS